MTKDKTLVILAAGMGSRFGGLKQIQPIDEKGNFIIDYSIYDAKEAGFNKVVFIIKEENQEIFENTVGNRVSEHIQVEYAHQKMDKFVETVPDGRVKPWGTAHAVLCAKDNVQGDFAIINADDLYGKDAFETAARFMDNNQQTNNYGLVAYQVGNTLTENGAVKRGVCEVENGVLTGMVESSVQQQGEQIVCKPLSGEEPFVVGADHPVSMNMICMHSDVFPYLENYFTNEFLAQNQADLAKGKDSKCECLIQDVLMAQANEGQAVIQATPTTAEWHGVTFKEDLPDVVGHVADAISQGIYPNPLWTVQTSEMDK